MDQLEDLFKKLIYTGLGTLVLIFVLPMVSTMGLAPRYIHQQTLAAEAMDPVIGILMLLILIVSIASIIMMLQYKHQARTVYLWSIIVSFPLALFSGVVIVDPFSYILGAISGMISGAILILVYFTPLKDKFTEQANFTTSKFSLSEELEKLNKMYQEGLINEEEFKAGKEKLLK